MKINGKYDIGIGTRHFPIHINMQAISDLENDGVDIQLFAHSIYALMSGYNESEMDFHQKVAFRQRVFMELSKISDKQSTGALISKVIFHFAKQCNSHIQFEEINEEVYWIGPVSRMVSEDDLANYPEQFKSSDIDNLVLTGSIDCAFKLAQCYIESSVYTEKKN